MSGRRTVADRRMDEDGSAVVSALAVGLVAAIAVTMLTARSVGVSSGSAATLDRAHAQALAEHGIAVALRYLDAGLALELRRDGPSALGVEQAVPIVRGDDSGTEWPPDAVVDVRVRVDEESEDVVVISSAQVRSSVTELHARVRVRTTSDYMMLSTYEVVDPILFQRPRATCAARRGDAGRSSDCVSTSLPTAVLDGPVHSNDVLDVPAGVAVASMLTTAHLVSADGAIGPALTSTSDVDALGASPFGLHHHPEITLPRTARSVSADAAVTCRFRGPTLIRFDGAHVRVTSPRSVPRADDVEVGDAAIGCLGVDRGLLVDASPILLPPRAVIEVVRDPDSDCAGHPLGLALTEDEERAWRCSDGDAFVWGAYRGARTVIAQDGIQIVWDVAPGGSGGSDAASGREGGDVLGLVAGDSIVLRRLVAPPTSGGPRFGTNRAFAGPGLPPFGAYPTDAPTADPSVWDRPVVVAALVALRGSVGIQNPLSGETHPGPLLIEGSVAARFRGLFQWEHRTATGALQGRTGYPLVLSYDREFLDAAPPGMPLTHGGASRILSLERVR